MERDEFYMRRALRLARRGLGKTSPNPMVGAVVVRASKVIGEGFHHRAGEHHAEILALKAAGRAARGAELFLNLEPCTHKGRTGPCAPIVTESGVRRVVIGSLDPNPRVAGHGAASLKKAGIEVSVGVLEDECRRLNEVFFHWIVTGRPFVIMKAGQSLDGKIATRTGKSQWITSEESRRQVHLLRSQVDAILVGTGTVLADDPSLTARIPKPGRQPIPIVLDANLITPPDAKVLRHPRGCIIATKKSAPASRRVALLDRGAQIWNLPSKGGLIEWRPLLKELGRREITSLLIEGGARVFSSALEAGVVNKIWLFIAPILIGGDDARGTVGGTGPAELTDCTRLKDMKIRRCGPDLWIEGYLE